MTKARANDQFLYALLAVIFGAVAVISMQNFREQQQGMVKPAIVREVNAQTPEELIGELNRITDEGVEADMGSLRQEADGL